jgi:hypothetical protein
MLQPRQHQSFVVDASQLAPGLRPGDIYFDEHKQQYLQVEGELLDDEPAGAAMTAGHLAATHGRTGSSVWGTGGGSNIAGGGGVGVGLGPAGTGRPGSVQAVMQKLHAEVSKVNPALWH